MKAYNIKLDLFVDEWDPMNLDEYPEGTFGWAAAEFNHELRELRKELETKIDALPFGPRALLKAYVWLASRVGKRYS